MFSGSDDYEEDYDDSSMAISGAMKEDLKREQRDSEITMFSHWNDDSDWPEYSQEEVKKEKKISFHYWW